MLLQVANELDRQSSTLYSFLATNGTAGGTVVPVKNINGFTDTWAIQLGRTGEETAEILTVSGAPSGTVLNTLGTAKYPHPLDTPIYNIHYDSVIFLRSTAGTAGTASALATVTITPDSFFTEYSDTSGVASYAYKTQYYNSVSGDTSGTSGWFVPGGPTFYSFQKLKKRAKDALFSANYIKDDDTIGDWINEWLEVMTNSAIKVNQGYSIGTALVSYAPATSGAIAYGTVTDAAFKQVVKLELTSDGTNYVNSREIPINQFGANDRFSATDPRHFWQGDTVFGVLPSGSGGTARLTYGIRTTPLSVDGDELPQSMKAYTTGCIEYVLYRAFDLDQKQEAAEGHWNKFLTLQNAFVSEITPRDQSGPKTIDFTEGLSGMNEDLSLATEYFM